MKIEIVLYLIGVVLSLVFILSLIIAVLYTMAKYK